MPRLKVMGAGTPEEADIAALLSPIGGLHEIMLR